MINDMDVPTQYRPLHKYLAGRFADTVVLTFGQIEDLIGLALPGAARLQQDWWANPEKGSIPSPQSSSWIEADRIASANLSAQTATFDRALA
jgi:hypothetical protein